MMGKLFLVVGSWRFLIVLLMSLLFGCWGLKFVVRMIVFVVKRFVCLLKWRMSLLLFLYLVLLSLMECR